MPEKRRSAFAAALPLEQWKSVAADTLVLSDPQTRRPILVRQFLDARPS